MTTSKLLATFSSTRAYSEKLCEPLRNEDFSVQPVEFVSPPKWHLAHSTWFFEQFILNEFVDGYTEYHPDFSFLFNSYYNNKGSRVLRPNRGNMTRPSVEEVLDYRKAITSKIENLLENQVSDKLLEVLEIGINHEQQHQELLAYDIKYILGNQPTFPSYENELELADVEKADDYIKVEEGIYEIGHKENSFSFDNELGVHKVYLNEFEISKNLVSNQDFLEFIDAGGYEDFNLWHADGWQWVNDHQINSPMYWLKVDGNWHYYDYSGLTEVEMQKPVTHISYYEAYAFAQWKNKRLPTEFEWEVASDRFKWGQLWEWTNSAYLPYPNFKTAEGALGEYNGKFMVNQMVLKGASIATPNGHERHTYRNFFQPEMRWLFSGIRLVK